MRKLTRNSILASAVAISALGLTAIPASANPMYVDISATGASGSSWGITATSSSVTAKDNTTTAAITCSSGAASGTTKLGTNITPTTGIASVTTLSLTSPANKNGWCSGPAGITVQVNPDLTTPWTLDATAVTAAGVTAGKLNGIKASIVGSDNCHATVSGPGGTGGSVTGSYNNTTHSLTTGGTGSTSNLTVQSVDLNCDPTLINAGDSISLNGTFVVTAVSPATGPLTLNAHN
ncbi:hypothetical protein AB0L06_20925 [Spirillospora sp. NPDC052269]